MSALSRRIVSVLAWLAFAAVAGIAVVLLFGQRPKEIVLRPRPLPQTAPATHPSAATAPGPLIVQTYGQLLHADLPNYPQTQPWAVAVDLADAAHLILSEPVYVCSRGDLWITRPDADPLPVVRARAGDESEHIVKDNIAYIVWSIGPRGILRASAICPTPHGFELISATGRRPLPGRGSYHWDRAVTWDDAGTIRLFVPTDDGISTITVGKDVTEMPCRLLGEAPAATGAAIPPPQMMFDAEGILAWIPADGDFHGPARIGRFCHGRWEYLDAASWPANIIQLHYLRDGSVLQIRRGTEAGTVQLTIVPLDSPAIDQAEIKRLAEQLADDDPDRRQAAFEKLTEYGPGVFPLLEKLQSNAAPEAKARIQQILQGRLTTSLGGMLVNDNQLTVAARLADGGAVFFAPQGVSIPQPDQSPRIVAPDYLVVRPGRPIQELPAEMVLRLGKSKATITALGDEWVLATDEDGPVRYLPPSQLTPLLRPSERRFSRWTAIDGRGRWLFHTAAGGSITQPTLILDPTVPDPTPRLAIWLIDVGDRAGWNSAGWPAFTKGTANWMVTDQGWETMAQDRALLTEPPRVPQPAATTTSATTGPDSSAPLGPALLVDAAGNRYFDGRATLTVITPGGKRRVWPLPPDCLASQDQPAFLAADRQGHLWLLNSQGKIALLRPTLQAAQPFVLEAVFARQMPDFRDILRLWLDPAGRIAVAYDQSHLALIFPTGQIPPPIADKILPQDLLRIDPP